MSSADPIVILAARRTPIGGFQGALSALASPQIGVQPPFALQWPTAVRQQTRLMEVHGLLLDVLAWAKHRRRRAGRGAASNRIGATTLTKMCGSGMKTVMLARE